MHVLQVKTKCDLFPNMTIWLRILVLIHYYEIVLDEQGLQISVLIESRAEYAGGQFFPGLLGSRGTRANARGMASGPPGVIHVTCQLFK